MREYGEDEQARALHTVSSNIKNCENMLPKFAEGTSQHSLLQNRIKALHISQALIAEDPDADHYTTEELTKALPPITSIISKCEKAIEKATVGTAGHTTLKNIINAMQYANTLLHHKLDKTN